MKYIIIILSFISFIIYYKKKEMKENDIKQDISATTTPLETKIIKDTLKSYYYNSDGTYDLGVHIYDIHDAFLFDYFCTMTDDGAINARWEEDQYAGKFLKSDIKNNKISFYIVNYRDETAKYLLNLSFLNDSTIHWYIDSIVYEYTPYLPHDFTLYKKRK